MHFGEEVCNKFGSIFLQFRVYSRFTIHCTYRSHFLPTYRGVQYVHWVMHKCIMVKVGGENTQKVCKKLVNFPKTGGKFLKVGGNQNFCQSGGKCTKTGKIGGEI